MGTLLALALAKLLDPIPAILGFLAGYTDVIGLRFWAALSLQGLSRKWPS
jgi:hypothetical protein